jgi:anti-sigma B factor antagonist
MEVRIDYIQDIEIVKVKGKLDNSTSGEFLDLILPGLEKEPGKMVINFKNVDYISSAGIRSLIILCKRIDAYGGKLVLTEANPNVLSLLKMADIPSVIPVLNQFEEILRYMDKAFLSPGG